MNGNIYHSIYNDTKRKINKQYIININNRKIKDTYFETQTYKNCI